MKNGKPDTLFDGLEEEVESCSTIMQPNSHNRIDIVNYKAIPMIAIQTANTRPRRIILTVRSWRKNVTNKNCSYNHRAGSRWS